MTHEVSSGRDYRYECKGQRSSCPGETSDLNFINCGFSTKELGRVEWKGMKEWNDLLLYEEGLLARILRTQYESKEEKV